MFVRILTRYILGEILSLTLIGCALFTFILFMPLLPHILEVVVRNSSTLTDVAQVFLFTLPNLLTLWNRPPTLKLGLPPQPPPGMAQTSCCKPPTRRPGRRFIGCVPTCHDQPGCL